MREQGILVDVPDRIGARGEQLIVPSSHQKRLEGFAGLRRRYTFLEGVANRDRPHYEEFQELHPFHISFAARWTAFSKAQRQTMASLRSLLELGPIKFNLSEPALKLKPRHALLVAQPNSITLTVGAHLKSLLRSASDLSRPWRRWASSSVDILISPISEDTLLTALTESIRQATASSAGLFLFWFVGHGKPGRTRQLELIVKNTDDFGVQWNRICERLREAERAEGAMILDCCYSGAARSRIRLCRKTAVCGAPAKANDPAEFRDDQGQIRCVTNEVVEILSNGLEARVRNILSELLNGARRWLGGVFPHPVDKTAGRCRRLVSPSTSGIDVDIADMQETFC